MPTTVQQNWDRAIIREGCACKRADLAGMATKVGTGIGEVVTEIRITQVWKCGQPDKPRKATVTFRDGRKFNVELPH